MQAISSQEIPMSPSQEMTRVVEDIGDGEKGSQAIPGLLLANGSNQQHV